MRSSFILAVLVSMVLLAGIATSRAAAAPLAPGTTGPAVTRQQVDDNDDTRVEVQLVVAGIVAALVVGGGTGAYLIRRRLGRIAPPPDQSGSGHH